MPKATARDYLDFIVSEFLSWRKIKWCLRMSPFERACYSFDFTYMQIAARRERLLP